MNKEDILTILNNECSYFLNILKHCQKGHFLLRGYFYDIETLKKFNHNIEYRTPKNMPLHIHNEINEYFEPSFKWKIRNGIFCYGFDVMNHKPKDLGYGIFYLFFPIGEFQYVYSPDHFDLFGSINQTKTDSLSLITTLIFKEDKLCEALKIREEFDYFSNEISVNAKSYYLVNISLANYISANIWR